MNSEALMIGAVIAVSLTSVYILVSSDWRYCIGALALQYVGVFLLVNASWPIEMAIVKVVAGWMAGAILGIAMTSMPDNLHEYEQSLKFGPAFKVIAAAILILAVASLVLHSENWLSIVSTPLRWGSFILIGIGLLQLSLTTHPLRIILGLLTALSGFEIIYAAIETSTLVTGLLAVICLGIALIGAYLLSAPTMEASQ